MQYRELRRSSRRELERQKPLILTAANLVFDCLHISFDISRRLHKHRRRRVDGGGGDEVHFLKKNRPDL